MLIKQWQDLFLTKKPSRQDVTRDEIVTPLYDHPDNDVIRIRWTSEDGSAIVTTGELRTALVDHAVDPAEIETLQFVSVQ